MAARLQDECHECRAALEALGVRARGAAGAAVLGSLLDAAMELEGRILDLQDRAGPLEARDLLSQVHALDLDVDALIVSLEDRLSPPPSPDAQSYASDATPSLPGSPDPGDRHREQSEQHRELHSGLHSELHDAQQHDAQQHMPDVFVTSALSDFRAPSAVGRRVRALYDFERQKPDDLSLKEGDVFTVIDINSVPNWWLVESQDGQRGYVPENFVTLVEVSGWARRGRSTRCRAVDCQSLFSRTHQEKKEASNAHAAPGSSSWRKASARACTRVQHTHSRSHAHRSRPS
jgi:hypothetical protein